MSSLTLEFVGRTLFGTDVRDEVAIVSDATQNLLEVFPTLMSPRGMLMARFPTPFRHRLRREPQHRDCDEPHRATDAAGERHPATRAGALA